MLTAASPQGLSHSRPVEDGRWRGSERELGNSRAIAHLQHVVVDEHVLAVEVEIVLKVFEKPANHRCKVNNVRRAVLLE